MFGGKRRGIGCWREDGGGGIQLFNKQFQKFVRCHLGGCLGRVELVEVGGGGERGRRPSRGVFNRSISDSVHSLYVSLIWCKLLSVWLEKRNDFHPYVDIFQTFGPKWSEHKNTGTYILFFIVRYTYWPKFLHSYSPWWRHDSQDLRWGFRNFVSKLLWVELNHQNLLWFRLRSQKQILSSQNLFT